MTLTSPSNLEIAASIIFGLAIAHTFLTNFFQRLSHNYVSGSILENLFHLLGEVEIVFGLWAGIFVMIIYFLRGWQEMLHLTDKMNFTEPIFVFAVMTVASSSPIINFAQRLILKLAHIAPFYRTVFMYFLCLSIGPLLGSFITEPAAMTVTALILFNQFYSVKTSDRFKYVTIAVLFVNVSIGGVLTNYAAPPVLMVADTWNWDTSFMFHTFGWKALIAVLGNTLMATAFLFKELTQLQLPKALSTSAKKVPFWLTSVHLIFLLLVVVTSHHSTFCVGVLLFFLGVTAITSEYQEDIKIRQSLLVAFFLGGLVVLGSFQSWWLSPFLQNLSEARLFIGATILTSFTDNAALTYLGSQVQNVNEAFKYALVAGAVTGGGLTVIANAPNPAGFSILQQSFGEDGINPGKLFMFAMPFTLIAMICFWFL